MAEQQTPNANNTSTNLSVPQLLGALDTQIKYETASQRNDGWTRWAIWGALAALIWVASDLWQQAELCLESVAALALLVFVIRRILEETVWMLLPISRLNIGGVRFRRFSDLISPLRPEIVYEGLQYLVAIFVLLQFRISGQWILWPYVVCGVALAGIRLIIGWLALGFPSRMSLWTAVHSTTFIHVVILAVAGWQLLHLVRPSSTHVALCDMRLALVLNASAFLVSRLVGMIPSEHLLSKLTQLRQHIAFGHIPLEHANKEAEELLSGITLAELFAPLVQSVEKELKARHTVIAETQKVLQELSRKLSSEEGQQHELLQALDRMGSPPTTVARSTKQLKRAWQRLAGNALGCSFYSPECRSELNAITNAVRSQLQESDALARECVERYHSMKSELYRQSIKDHPLP